MMNRTFAFFITSLATIAACSRETPTEATRRPGAAVFAKPNGQTQYAITLQGGLTSDASHPFFVLAKTGDPFSTGVSGDPVYLTIPAEGGGDVAVCNAGSTLNPSTSSWGTYPGVWKGTFGIAAHTNQVNFNGTRADGSGGTLLLAVKGTPVKSNNNLTLTYTNARGLVSAYSSPDGGMPDAQDRCLTFSVTATP